MNTTTPPQVMLRLKVSEYAKREGVSLRTAKRWIEKGAIPIVRIGPTKRIRVLVESQEINGDSQGQTGPTGPLPSR